MAGEILVELSQQLGRLAAAQEASAEAFKAHDREEVEDRRIRAEREAEEVRRLYERIDQLKARLDQVEGAYKAIITVGSVLAGVIGMILTAVSIWKN